MRDILVTLVVFGLLPVVLMRPPVGILLWSWLGYMNPHRLTWGFAYDFPFAQLTAIATIVGFVFWREPKKFPVNSTTIIWLLFTFWFTLTTFFALDWDAAWYGWDRAIKIQLIALLTLVIMRREDRVRALVWVIALSLGFFGLKGGLYTFRTGAEHRVWGPVGSFIQDNNALALALIMTLPLIWFLFLHYRNRYLRTGLIIVALLTLLSILGSYSRGALLAGSAMLFFLWIKGRYKLKVGLVLLIIMPFLIAFMPQQWFERMKTIETYQQDKSAMGRITAWEFAIDMANQRPTGGGFEAFTEENYWRFSPDIAEQIKNRDNRYQGAHSIYFRVLGEHGYVGLLLFLALGISAYRTASRVIRRAREHPELGWAADLAAMLQVSLVGFAVGGAFQGLTYFDLYYHLVGLLVLLRVIVEDRFAESSMMVQSNEALDAAEIAAERVS